jgi:hypothetical protein
VHSEHCMHLKRSGTRGQKFNSSFFTFIASREKVFLLLSRLIFNQSSPKRGILSLNEKTFRVFLEIFCLSVAVGKMDC